MASQSRWNRIRDTGDRSDVGSGLLSGGAWDTSSLQFLERRERPYVRGGHSIDSPEPIFGLVVAGTVHPDKLKANSTAKAGDDLVLTKPLGVGVMTTALKGGKLGPEGYAEALATMTRLNSVGPVLADIPSVHAITDVTGFGLFGHLLEVCRGSGVRAVVDFPNLPVMEHAVPVAKLGTFPGAVKRNLESYGEYISYEESVQPLENWQKSLMADPQTSGGLLVAVDPSATDTVLQKLREDGLAHAAVIGRLVDGDVGIVVRNP
ncbi:hypothetical protein CBR_g29398 [Chara braunii]|uniref:PurM-like C-terminal domain-containing protein n=1 Tax=Chara braunii TaxID=69332 RepID=A0A388JWN5_CHABU|nr:hypothetical protein CBR_g29398 [Chara braunii]|eukprot:GBG62200.1 hypothetical protein CBR_g29398 [Chara braunii]